MGTTDSAGQGVRSAALLLCFLAALCEGVDLQAAGVAASGLAAVFRPTPSALGVFFSASTLGLLIGALIGGRSADRVGRKRILVASIVAFGVFSLLTPMAWNMASLSGMRFLTGLGLGGAFPNLIALVSESAPAVRRRAHVAAVYAATPLGGALVSLLSLAISKAHWSWIFIAGGVLPLCLAPALALGLPESPAFRQLSVAGSSHRRVSVSAAVQALFLRGRALRTALLWSAFFLGLLTLYLLLNWLPTILSESGFSRSQSGVAQMAFNVGGAVAAVAAGRLFEGRHTRLTVVASFVAVPVLLATLALSHDTTGAMALIVLLLGCGVMAGQAYLYAVAPISYPTEIRGFGVGAAIAAGRCGSIVGPLFGGWLSASGASAAGLLLDLVPVAAVCAILAIALAWRIPTGGEQPLADAQP